MCYVGRIEKLESGEDYVKFMRKQSNETFIFPEKNNLSFIQKLPEPLISGVKRVAVSLSF